MSKSEMTYVHVTPWLLGWQIKVNGRRVSRFTTQHEAQACATFLARLMSPATLKLHKRNGRIRDEATFNRSADPKKTPG